MATSSIGQRISELPNTNKVNENDTFPKVNSDNTNRVTEQVTLGQLRALLNFENAYTTINAGLAVTKSGEIFFVYTDTTKYKVNGYTNKSGIAEPILDTDGSNKTWTTGALLKSFGDVVSEIGFGIVGSVPSFGRLRSLKPASEGFRVNVREHTAGTGLGGGEFIGHLGTATDDGGITAAGDGFYWKRANTDVVTPFMFGALDDKATDSSTAFQLMFDSGATNISLAGKSFGVSKSLSITKEGTIVRNGRIYVLDAMTDTWVFGLNASHCKFIDLWSDLNGTTAAGMFSAISSTKGVNGKTPCESLICNRGTSHYTQVVRVYATRSAGSKPAFSFSGVDKCLYTKVVDCTVEYSGSMFFTMSGYNEVINPVCSNINDAGIAFNTGGAQNCVVRGGFVHNCRYGGIAVESGSHDVLIEGVTFTQPKRGDAGNVIQRGDILISSFTEDSADCYNVDIVGCHFNQGTNSVASTSTDYKQSIYITNGNRINIRNNTFITQGYSNDGTEAVNTFIYLTPIIAGKNIWNLNISNNDVRYGCFLKIWSSINCRVGNIRINGNQFDSQGYIVNFVQGNTVAYYPGGYDFGIKVEHNSFSTTKLITGSGSSKAFQYTSFLGNSYGGPTLTALDATQINALNLRQIKISNFQGDILSDTVPNVGMWQKGEVVKTVSTQAAGAIGWICQDTGAFASASWVTATAYTEGTRVYNTDGLVYECTVAGTSGTTNPVGQVIGVTETDGTVTWKCLGKRNPAFLSLGTYPA